MGIHPAPFYHRNHGQSRSLPCLRRNRFLVSTPTCSDCFLQRSFSLYVTILRKCPHTWYKQALLQEKPTIMMLIRWNMVSMVYYISCLSASCIQVLKAITDSEYVSVDDGGLEECPDPSRNNSLERNGSIN